MSHFLEILLQVLGCFPGTSSPKGSEMGRMERLFAGIWSAFLVLLILGGLAWAFLP